VLGTGFAASGTSAGRMMIRPYIPIPTPLLPLKEIEYSCMLLVVVKKSSPCFRFRNQGLL